MRGHLTSSRKRAIAGAVICAGIVAGTAACGGSGSPGNPLSGMDPNKITMDAFQNLKNA